MTKTYKVKLIKKVLDADILYLNVFDRWEPYYKNSEREYFRVVDSNTIEFCYFDGRNGSSSRCTLDDYKKEWKFKEHEA